jgi:hypothetical protein
MANHSHPQRALNLTESSTRVLAANFKISLVLAVAVALFLFVGAAHAQSGPCPAGQSPCILVSNIGTNNEGYYRQLEVWADSGGGAPLIPNFLKCPQGGCPGGGAGAGEGIACVSGSANVMYIANASNFVNAFNLTTGQYITGSTLDFWYRQSCSRYGCKFSRKRSLCRSISTG